MTRVRVGTDPGQLAALANLSQQLVSAVAKQTEGQVVVDAEDGSIVVQQQEAAQRSKRPNCSRVLQRWA